MKPTIFIGSSTEGLPLARAVKRILSGKFAPKLWTDDIFELGEDNLNNLLKFAQCYDFAVLVFTDDDLTTSRRVRKASPRDNVVLEIGLFMGSLGRRRTFAILSQTEAGTPKIPSDLLGNSDTTLPRDLHKTLNHETLKKKLKKLIATIETRSKESYLELLPSTSLALGYFNNFIVPVCQELSRIDTVTLNRKAIDIREGNFDFHIVLPKSLSDASVDGARRFVKKHRVQDFVLKLPPRLYPFYVSAKLKKGRILFYDYPTTLGSSHEAIKITLAGNYLGRSAQHSLLDLKEIRNFQRTLSLLMEQGVAAGFRDNIKFIQL